jgi:hypothetical protein
VIGAEANPRLAAYHTASKARRSEIEVIANRAAAQLRATLNSAWDGRGSYGDLFPSDRVALGEAWGRLVKAPFDLAEGLPISEVGDTAIAAQLLVGSLGFGSNIRTSRNGLNVPPNPQKLLRFRRIVPFPCIAGLHLVSSASDLEFDGRDAIALIDPPYVVPTRTKATHKLLTACYPNHQPYGQATWDLYWETIASAMRQQAKTLSICNYYSSEFDCGVGALATAFNYQITARRSFGVMGAQGAGHRTKHGLRAQAPNKLPHMDTEWILERRRGRPRAEQGCLFFTGIARNAGNSASSDLRGKRHEGLQSPRSS